MLRQQQSSGVVTGILTIKCLYRNLIFHLYWDQRQFLHAPVQIVLFTSSYQITQKLMFK